MKNNTTTINCLSSNYQSKDLALLINAGLHTKGLPKPPIPYTLTLLYGYFAPYIDDPEARQAGDLPPIDPEVFRFHASLLDESDQIFDATTVPLFVLSAEKVSQELPRKKREGFDNLTAPMLNYLNVLAPMTQGRKMPRLVSAFSFYGEMKKILLGIADSWDHLKNYPFIYGILLASLSICPNMVSTPEACEQLEHLLLSM